MEHTESPNVRAARRNIAERVAPILWQIGIHTADAVHELTDDSWTLALLVAGGIERDNAAEENRKVEWRPTPGYLPGRRTVDLIATMINFRAREITTAATAEVDVFAGLPGVDD